jgi:hypothetical protein
VSIVERFNSFVRILRAKSFSYAGSVCVVFNLGLTLPLVDRRGVNSDGSGFTESNNVVGIHEFGAEPVVDICEDGVAHDFVMIGENISECICFHSAFNGVKNALTINVTLLELDISD